MEYIATTNSKLDLGNFEAASISIEKQDNFKCGGHSALAGSVEITLTSITDKNNPGVCASAVVIIKGTSITKANGSRCLLVGDKGSTVAIFTGKPETRTITVKIKDAGQKEVKSI